MNIFYIAISFGLTTGFFNKIKPVNEIRNNISRPANIHKHFNYDFKLINTYLQKIEVFMT